MIQNDSNNWFETIKLYFSKLNQSLFRSCEWEYDLTWSLTFRLEDNCLWIELLNGNVTKVCYSIDKLIILSIHIAPFKYKYLILIQYIIEIILNIN